MLPDFTHELLPLVVLYPEIHYRFRAFQFSRYFRRHPEILSDVPRRLDPGKALPVLLIVKDADRFPVTLISVSINAEANGRTFSRIIQFNKETVNKRWWHYIEQFDLPDESPCDWKVTLSWTVEINGKSITFINDNYPGFPARQFTVRQSGERLPGEDDWIFGDLHVHTAFTEDQVEFGAPLSAYPILGSAAGFSFTMVADHSYDLDDLPGSFIEPDPNLNRFKARNAQIRRLNDEHNDRFCILPGFELSTGNSRGRNVHLLMLNQMSFLPGSGDAAERWLQTRPELSISQAIEKMDADALAIAAHPLAKTPLLQKLLLRRGDWEESDYSHERLSGLQIWNGVNGGELEKGLTRWVAGLLAGRKWKIFAGSDAHGNFNRHIKVATPMLTLAECDNQRFGEVWTGVKVSSPLSSDSLTNALQTNPSLISNGPFAIAEKIDTSGSSSIVKVRASSSVEFGALSSVKVYSGKAGESEERLIYDEQPKGAHYAEFEIDLNQPPDYVRVSTSTSLEKQAHTNPFYL